MWTPHAHGAGALSRDCCVYLSPQHSGSLLCSPKATGCWPAHRGSQVKQLAGSGAVYGCSPRESPCCAPVRVGYNERGAVNSLQDKTSAAETHSDAHPWFTVVLNCPEPSGLVYWAAGLGGWPVRLPCWQVLAVAGRRLGFHSHCARAPNRKLS